jgi:hypothetical protein
VETPQINLRVRKNPSLPEIAPRQKKATPAQAKFLGTSMSWIAAISVKRSEVGLSTGKP